MTSQGSAQGRFQRAIANGNLWAAETAARELGRLPLGGALALTALIADAGDAELVQRPEEPRGARPST